MRKAILLFGVAASFIAAAALCTLAVAKDNKQGLATSQIVIPKSADVSAPRDAASGLPTGKRMHKPYSNNSIKN